MGRMVPSFFIDSIKVSKLLFFFPKYVPKYLNTQSFFWFSTIALFLLRVPFQVPE